MNVCPRCQFVLSLLVADDGPELFAGWWRLRREREADGMNLREIELALIYQAIDEAGSVRRAAIRLGVSYSTLYRKLGRDK